MLVESPSYLFSLLVLNFYLSIDADDYTLLVCTYNLHVILI
jgi:hypothetical protein